MGISFTKEKQNGVAFSLRRSDIYQSVFTKIEVPILPHLNET